MPTRTLTRVKPSDRLAKVNSRLAEILKLDSSMDNAVRMQRLENMRNPDKGTDIATRCELAYLIKLATQLVVNKPVYVETVIAGRPEDSGRRVFARIVRDDTLDGTTLELYNGRRTREFESIPAFIETAAPTRRRKVSKDV